MLDWTTIQQANKDIAIIFANYAKTIVYTNTI